MSYEDRVVQAVREANEAALLKLIEEDIEAVEDKVKAKENAINGLAQLYIDQGHPQKIQFIAE